MPLLIQRASAGSGKTEQLARRYLQLLLAPNSEGCSIDPTTIFAATFTREAAGEMLARIFKILARACSQEKTRLAIVEGTPLPPPTQQKCLQLLRLLAEHIDRLSIQTIDALFAKYGQALALDLGLAPCWQIADSTSSSTLAKAAILQLIEKNPHFSKDWRALHFFTRRFSFLEEAALLLEKNRFLVTADSLSKRVSAPVAPLLFSQKETAQTLFFLEHFSPPTTAQGKPNVSWKKALQKLEAAFKNKLFLKDLLGLGTLMTACLESEPTFYGKELPPEFLTYFFPLVQASAAEQCRLSLLREETLHRLIKEYQQCRYEVSYEAGLYTFGEIEEKITHSLHRFSNAEITRLMESSVEHLLLDEYQDTSQRQHDFLSPLINDVLAKGGISFVVGDTKQGIYGWRGGKRHLLRSLEEEYAAFVIETPPLHESYRSSSAVLSAVNEVFSALSEEKALEAMEADAAFRKAAIRWSLDFEPQKRASHLQNLIGRVELHETAMTREEPLRDMVEKVVQLVLNHRQEDPERAIAILVRRTKFIPQLLSALREHGVLASGEGGNPVTDTLAVEVLLSLLSWIDHPGATAARAHVASSPLAELLCDPQEQQSFLLRKQIMAHGLASMLRTWIALPSFYEACSNYEQARLKQLVMLAHRFDASGKGTLSDFVEQARSERIESPLNQGVRVMSIHASKGLEFETVILMDLDTNIFSGAQEKWRVRQQNNGDFFIQTSSAMMALQGREKLLEELHEEQWAEALSLLYVGMTRAISYLDLVILPVSDSSKKSIARWLRASGITSHHGAGRSWREQKKEALPKNDTSHKASSFLDSSSLRSQKLSLRSPSHARENGFVLLAQQFQDRGASQEGLLKHALLAEIEWFEKKTLTAESWAKRTLPHVSFSKALQAAEALLKQFQDDQELLMTFDRSSFLKKWHLETVSEIWRERSFAVVLDDKKELLSGTFDRVALGSSLKGPIGVIIDFKTAPQRFEEREERALFYQPQLDAYRQALQQLAPSLVAIETKIIWI